MKFAIVENDFVKNIIVADQSFVDAHYPGSINVDDIQCGMGWSYDGKNFIAPIVLEEVDELAAE
jgi:hypothetical protein